MKSHNWEVTEITISKGRNKKKQGFNVRMVFFSLKVHSKIQNFTMHVLNPTETVKKQLLQ